MKPVDNELKKREYILTQQCVKCKHARKNKIIKNDNLDKVIELSKNKIFNLPA
jgi:hypothetical protein